jgi:hypothetical protein
MSHITAKIHHLNTLKTAEIHHLTAKIDILKMKHERVLTKANRTTFIIGEVYMYVFMCVIMYIFIYICMCICMYIYEYQPEYL